ncbi:MAG: efflux RND transporter permease subunit [Pseudomonadota bacterium]
MANTLPPLQPASPVSWRHWLLARPRRVLTVGFMLTLLMAAGALRLGFSHDYRVFFDAANPELAAHEALEARFTQSDSVNFVLHAHDGDFLQADRLEALAALTKAAWQIPHVIRVESLTNFQNSYAEGEDLVVAPLYTGALNEDTLARMKTAIADNAGIKDRLLSADGRTAQVIATLQLPQARDNLLPAIAEAVNAIRANFAAAHPDMRIAVTGVAMLSYTFFDITQRDMAFLFPVMVVFLGLLMALFFRSSLASIIALSIMALSIAAAMGLGGWLGLKLTPASGQAPIIVLTVAIADSIHLIVTVMRLMRRGMAKPDAIAEALRVNFQPILLTSLTTALGFLSFNFSDTPPFRDLGNIAAAGTLLALFYSLTILPVLLVLVPFRVAMQKPRAEKLQAAFVGFVIAKRKAVLVASLLALIGLGALIPRLVINDNFIEWISRGERFRDDADFINAHLPGIYAVQFSLGANSEGGIAEPFYLATLAAFADWLGRQEEVAQVYSFDQVMRRLNRNMHGDDPAYDRLPASRELAAQYLLLYEMSLPYGLDLNNQIDVRKSATRVVVMLHNVSSARMEAFKTRAEAWLAREAPTLIASPATGTNIVFAHLTQSNMRAMFVGTLTAFLLIAAVMALALRSVTFGLLSLVPNITPAVMAFGAWSLIHAEIGLYAAFVTATALGLIVDTTVHFFSKFLRARREEGLTPEEAVRAVFASTGPAMWIAALALVAGFLVLTASKFAIIALMAGMVALTISFGLVADFTLTPALLLAVEGASGSPARATTPSSPILTDAGGVGRRRRQPPWNKAVSK